MCGSVDVVIFDRNIFNYFKFVNSVYVEDVIVFYEFFFILFYSVVIFDLVLRVKFNVIFWLFIEDGWY